MKKHLYITLLDGAPDRDSAWKPWLVLSHDIERGDASVDEEWLKIPNLLDEADLPSLDLYMERYQGDDENQAINDFLAMITPLLEAQGFMVHGFADYVFCKDDEGEFIDD